MADSILNPRPSEVIKAEMAALDKELDAALREERGWPKLFHVTAHREEDDRAEEFATGVLGWPEWDDIPYPSPEFDRMRSVSAAMYESTGFFAVDRDGKVECVGYVNGDTIFGTPWFLDKYADPDYDVWDMSGDPCRQKRMREYRAKQKGTTQ